MKSWRERIAEAEGRRWRAFGLTLWPGRFSADDHAATSRIFSDMNPGKPVCAIGEMRDRYGIELDHAMIALGSEWQRYTWLSRAGILVAAASLVLFGFVVEGADIEFARLKAGHPVETEPCSMVVTKLVRVCHSADEIQGANASIEGVAGVCERSYKKGFEPPPPIQCSQPWVVFFAGVMSLGVAFFCMLVVVGNIWVRPSWPSASVSGRVVWSLAFLAASVAAVHFGTSSVLALVLR